MTFFKAIVLLALSSLVLLDAQECNPKIYVATYGKDIDRGQVSVSSDGGQTFEILMARRQIEVIRAVGDNVYVGHFTGFSISNDGGSTWSNHPTGTVLDIYARDNEVCVVAANANLFYSKDNGKTFENSKLNFADLAAIYVPDSRIIVGSKTNGTFTSDDGGKTWKQVTSVSLIPIVGVNGNIFGGLASSPYDSVYVSMIPGLSSGNNTFSIGATDSTVYAGTSNDGLAVSSDSGNQWQIKTTADGLISNLISSVSAGGNYVVVGTDQGVSISSDGGSTWANKQNYPNLPYNLVTAAFVQCV